MGGNKPMVQQVNNPTGTRGSGVSGGASSAVTPAASPASAPSSTDPKLPSVSARPWEDTALAPEARLASYNEFVLSKLAEIRGAMLAAEGDL